MKHRDAIDYAKLIGRYLVIRNAFDDEIHGEGVLESVTDVQLKSLNLNDTVQFVFAYNQPALTLHPRYTYLFTVKGA